MNRAVALSAAFVMAPLLSACDKIVFGEQTSFSSTYSEANFKRIKAGMAVQEVLALLGEPIARSTQTWSEVWSYCAHETVPKNSALDGTSVYNLFGSVTHVRFTQAGLVARVSGDYLDGDFIGLTKAQVRQKVGEPTVLEAKPFEIIYLYSAPRKPGMGTYKGREVHLDASSKVTSVVAKTYYN